MHARERGRGLHSRSDTLEAAWCFAHTSARVCEQTRARVSLNSRARPSPSIRSCGRAGRTRA
eukprot:6191747-Pleurochrysis_carterae.AAC.2